MDSKEKKNCIVDCRVSSQKQITGGGLDEQKIVCVSFADVRGWNKLKIFSKIYSGRAEEREDFETILSYIKELKLKGIQVHYYLIKSIDRFTRDGAVTFEEMKNRLEHLGVEVVDTYGIIQPKVNTLEDTGFEYPWSRRSSTETAQLVEAQRAKNDVGDSLTRMVGASIRTVQKGYKVRRANDGYANNKIMVDGKRRIIEIPDPDRMHYFIKMFEMRAKLIPDKEIVKKLNSIGFLTPIMNRWSKDKMHIIGKIGGNKLTVKQLQRYIERTIYAGVRIEKWTYNKPILAQYEGLVSVELFNKANHGKVFIKKETDGSVKVLRNYSPWKKQRNKNNPDYPLRFLLCSECRQTFLGSASKGKLGTPYPAYHCGGATSGKRTHKYIRIPKEEFEKNVRYFVDNMKFDSDFINSLEYVFLKRYRLREKEIVQEASQINRNVSDLKGKQAMKLRSFDTTESNVVRRKLEEEIEQLDGEILFAETQRNSIEVTEKKIKAFIRYAKHLMEHPVEMLINIEDMHVQQALFSLVFENTPTYQEILNGTPKLTPIFRLSEEFVGQKSLNVTPRGIEPRFAP